ncbi:hypothetical protein [Duganella levis]|uniref:Uncharacterized protein n=1 Tax=Duganella levis TaxID=2692169 RepID=A0ABW9VW03_9BURK|nr:hypothetical protein [Duganella levis]MYN25840.1 hypothetical protein [Duganella levis]
MHKYINWELVMHFWVNVFYLLNLAAGAVVIEMAARGMKWIGVSDFSYYVMSGMAHLLLVVDAILFFLLLCAAARKLFRKAANESQS